MAPLPSSLDLPEYNNRFLLQDFESNIGIPLALGCVEQDEGDGGAPCDYYLCCFADYSGRLYNSEDLLAIPVPPAFRQLPQLMPVEGDLRRLFAPRAMISSYDQSGKSRVNEWALPIGGGHV
ncbi:hypothetical protein BC827DRAFT_1157189 [Russula dissimulans]|nr:hypothetical protein BC827DRAFT_1270115 [Russula dissimulans]KAH9957573.1 hypothetical protein BC827DRAFT_1157189 [Russula dissimulans]